MRFVWLPAAGQDALVREGCPLPEVPVAGIAIDAVFENVVVTGAVDPSVNVNVTIPRFVAPS